MLAHSIRFKGHKCFKDHFVGFDETKPINILIGKNNSGKSQMLDFVEALCGGVAGRKGWSCEITSHLDETALKTVFPPGTSGGMLGGDFWDDHGRHFIGETIRFTLGPNGQILAFDIDERILSRGPRRHYDPKTIQARLSELRKAASQWNHDLAGRTFTRLAAERNIRPEPAASTMNLAPDGTGATNIIRRYLNSASLDRELV